METATLRSLIDIVKNSGTKYCFIIGAGASRSSGIKTGWEMAKEWIDELETNDPNTTQEWKNQEQIEKDNLGSYYSKIYERRFNLNPAYGFKRLKSEMEAASPSAGYYYLAEILNGTQHKLVITTNFDSLTEDALFIYKDKKALVITHESLANYIDALSDRPIIIKLHRDLLLQPKSNEVDVNKLSDEWENSLRKIFDIYDPIVIGYGGNDGSLMGFLDSVSSKDKAIYWCHKKEEEVSERIKELLEKYRGFLIPIDDFDDTMHNFGTAFNFNFSPETIQNVTKERAEKLIEKYQEWKENRRKTLETKKLRSDTESMTYDSFHSLSNRKIAEFERMIVSGQQNKEVYNNLGDEYYWKNDYSKAIKFYSKAIELDPNNAKYYNIRGVCYSWLKEYENATTDHTKAIELDPNNAKYYNSRGVCYSLLKEYEKATTDCTKAIELDPNNAKYYNSRGVCYSLLREYEKATTDCTKAIELDPNNVDYYLSLSIALCSTNDFNNAIIYLNTAMSFNDEFHRCYAVRGYIGLKKAKQNKTECTTDVLNDLNRAIELDANYYQSYVYRSEYHLYTNTLDNAYNDLQKAITIDPNLGKAYFFMARYFEMQGNSNEYEHYMSKSKELRYIPLASDY